MNTFDNYLFILEPGNVLIQEKTAISILARYKKYVGKDELAAFKNDTDLLVVPVGSVEYTQKYAEYNGIKLPDSITYPESVWHYLKRNIQINKYVDVPDHHFVKPITIKSFNGGIKQNLSESPDPDELVYHCQNHTFDQEFRFYVLHGKIKGWSRYDDLETTNKIPPTDIVLGVINDFINQPVGYAIDVGYFALDEEDGCLIEVNDGWSLGFYKWGSMGTMQYISLITQRWEELVNQSY